MRLVEGVESGRQVDAANELLKSHPDGPVVVRSDGILVKVRSEPAIVSALIADGRDVYYEHFWGREDYDYQRRVKRAPAEHLTLHLLEQRDDRTWPDVGSDEFVDVREIRLKRTNATVRLVLTKSR